MIKYLFLAILAISCLGAKGPTKVVKPEKRHIKWRHPTIVS